MSIRARWPLTSGIALRRGAVEHDRHGGAALGGLLEEAPRHLVGVARGRGDEQPQVGGREQLGGEAAVALLDRVDVGGVQQRQALRHRRRRRPAGAHRGRRSRGVVRSRSGRIRCWSNHVGVVGVVDEHGRARRRTEYAGLADPLPDQGVHQRRLAGAGGPTDDREQRRVDLDQPRQHVVLELVDHLRAAAPGSPDAGDVEGQAGVLQRLAQAGQGGQHLGGARAPLRPTGRLSRRVPGVRHRPAPLPGRARRCGIRTGRRSPVRLWPEQARPQRAHPVDVLLADRREVGRGDAAEEAAVQEAELDGLVLVGDHRAPRGLATDLLGVPPGEAAGRDPREPRDLGRVEEATLGAVAERGREHRTLAAARPDREPGQQQERRHHQEEVGRDRVATVVEHQRAVPGGVRARRRRGSRRPGRPRAPPRLRAPTAMPIPMPMKAVKNGWANGPKTQRTMNRPDGAADPAGLAVLAHVRRGQVEDVLGEGEADAHHAGVHQAVEDAVELVPAVDQQQQDEQPLGRLLGDRRDHRGA